ncbi:HNH endonuclease signature motif containing protein [Microbacterium testaceum]|uniref:HNH endonuclease signature motif containing protein n=1 Tax=Microbacterium testaceum TaxID=2033 RepID=UPI001247521D|nr:HNH endonuclease signature motif containing protein [Microbacterium testaceum]
MTRSPRSADRPTPVFRECDGAPWPSDDELEFEAEWAAFRESGDVEWWTDADSPAPGEVSVLAGQVFPCDGLGGVDAWEGDALAHPLDSAFLAVSDVDGRVGHLENVVAERQRATAEEYRLILAILDDAAFDPTPWVGPDPTLDRAWQDPRGRTPRAVRRDRVDLAERAAVAEIAVRLHLSEQTVRTRAAHARTLAVGCPKLWAAFGEGRLSERHAVDAARLASTLPAGDADAFARFDDEACPPALVLTPAKFAVAARAIRERVHAESIEARHRRAAEDRGVWMRAELDGMASLHALLPADRAHAVMSRLDKAARHVRAAPDEERTLAQLRADAFADLVTMTDAPKAATTAPPVFPNASVTAPGANSTTRSTPSPASHGASPVPHDGSPAPHDGSPAPHGGLTAPPDGPPAPHDDPPATRDDPPAPVAPASPRTFRSAPPATIIFTVPALTLLGADTEPATLEGYGPIDLDTARRLAGTATSWIRLLTHPVTGAPLVLDRKTYRVPVALRRWLGITSPTCVFPGCNRAARDCDIDHLTAWADGGTTDDDNLDPKCRHHHRLRHETRWDIDHPPDAPTTWVSPLGGTYDTDPPPF